MYVAGPVFHVKKPSCGVGDEMWFLHPSVVSKNGIHFSVAKLPY